MRTIDADAMKAEVKSLDAESNNRIYQCAMEAMLEFFIELIDKQPTIEPEVRHGEWHESWYTETVCASICTNCGKATTQARTQEIMINVNYPLCPHCGADMREVREDEID